MTEPAKQMTLFNPPLPGGFNNNLLSIYPDHCNIYLMYQGTIDLDNPVANGEAEMGNGVREVVITLDISYSRAAAIKAAG
ncbi:MAG: hypothetical protein U9Q58_05400 [Pseudomonadota bacterium]|nr:hypothetical protein [Pseudomonadota bacterium]